MSDFAHNAYAEQRRLDKATALETALTGEGIGSDAVRAWDGDRWVCTLPEQTRRRIEKAAGTRKASDETWLLAAALLADYEDNRRKQRELT